MNRTTYTIKWASAALIALSLASSFLCGHPNVPQITYLFPQGAQRGTTAEATIGGQFLQEASEVRVSGSSITATIDKSAYDRVNAKFRVAPDVEPGTYEVRVITSRGISNTLLFTVGTLNEINESEPNNEIANANPVTPPITINGKIEPGEDQDCFLLRAEAGQRLLFDLDASRSGSALDASLTLLDKEGRELAFNEDFYTWDPFIDYTFAKAGEYVVRVRGIGGRGGSDFTYRLSIHAQPHLDYIFPLGGRRGLSVEATLGGRLLRAGVSLHAAADSRVVAGKPSGTKVQLNIGPDAPLGGTELRLQQGTYLSNAVRFDISDLPEVFESEPNDRPQQANAVAWPVIINGQFDHANDVDHFKFSAKKDERLYFEVRAHQLGSPVDAVLTLLDKQGRELATNDDPVAASFNEPANWDAKLSYLFKADGEYIVQIRDLVGQGGEGYPYRLLIRRAEPTFTLKVTPENPAVEQGKKNEMVARIIREEGFEGEVDLSVSLTKGVRASGSLKIPAKETKATIELEADDDARPGLVPVHLIGRACFEDARIEKEAVGVIKLPRVSGQDVLRMSERITLSVVEPPPFALEVKPDKVNLKLGATATVRVKATRRTGFTNPIQLSMLGLPKRVEVKPINLMPGQDEAELVIEAAPDAAKGNTSGVVLTGTAEVMGQKKSEQTPIGLSIQ